MLIKVNICFEVKINSLSIERLQINGNYNGVLELKQKAFECLQIGMRKLLL